jgi:hypothetical protein
MFSIHFLALRVHLHLFISCRRVGSTPDLVVFSSNFWDLTLYYKTNSFVMEDLPPPLLQQWVADAHGAFSLLEVPWGLHLDSHLHAHSPVHLWRLCVVGFCVFTVRRPCYGACYGACYGYVTVCRP